MSDQGGICDNVVDGSTKGGRPNPVQDDETQQHANSVASSSIDESSSLDTSVTSNNTHSPGDSYDKDLIAIAAEIKCDCNRLLPHLHAFETAIDKMKVLKVEYGQLEKYLKYMDGSTGEELEMPREMLRLIVRKIFIDLQSSSYRVIHEHVIPLSEMVAESDWILFAAVGPEFFGWNVVRPFMTTSEFQEAKEITMLVKAFEEEIDVWNAVDELFRASRMALGFS